MIRKKFNLDVLIMETLVEEAIEFANNNPNAIEGAHKEEKKEGEDSDKDSLSDCDLSEDTDEELNHQEDFR